jgi:hypothetical protein
MILLYAAVAQPAVILGLTAVALYLIWTFGYRLIVGQKSGSVQQTPNGTLYTDKAPSALKNPYLWGIVVVVMLYIFALTQVKSENRAYNPKKDGIPKIQTDSTKMAAEDFPKK